LPAPLPGFVAGAFISPPDPSLDARLLPRTREPSVGTRCVPV
jgi:hypothetical protein